MITMLGQSDDDKNKIFGKISATHNYAFNTGSQLKDTSHTNLYSTVGGGLESILKNQGVINGITLEISKTPHIGNSGALMDYTNKLNESVGKISGMSMDARILTEPVSYDFINKPFASSMTTAVDNIALYQGEILNGLTKYNLCDPQIKNKHAYNTRTYPFVTEHISPFIKDEKSHDTFIAPLLNLTSPAFNFKQKSYYDVRTPELILNDAALDALKETTAYSGLIDVRVSPRDKIDEKIKFIEEEISKMKKANHMIALSVISDDVEKLLRKLNKELAQNFRGAVSLLYTPNDDSIGQSAESMTRLFENLPISLSPGVVFKSKEKEYQIKECLAIYFGIEYLDPKKDIKDSRIDKQQYFYSIFSQIRHRKKGVYDKYKNDPSLYKALLIQSEIFIYQILRKVP